MLVRCQGARKEHDEKEDSAAAREGERKRVSEEREKQRDERGRKIQSTLERVRARRTKNDLLHALCESARDLDLGPLRRRRDLARGAGGHHAPRRRRRGRGSAASWRQDQEPAPAPGLSGDDVHQGGHQPGTQPR